MHNQNLVSTYIGVAVYITLYADYTIYDCIALSKRDRLCHFFHMARPRSKTYVRVFGAFVYNDMHTAVNRRSIHSAFQPSDTY